MRPLRLRLPLAALATLLAFGAGCRSAPEDGTIVASGHVEATEVRLAAKVGGRLLSLEAEEGAAVSRGQVLARIDTTDLELALAAARAERAQADALLRLSLAGARAEEIREARAQVARAEAELDGARRDLERMQGLLDSGSGTPKSRDDARVRRDASAAALEAARERLQRLETGARPEEKDAARARLAAADARIAQVEQQIADATVTSPLAGVLTEKLSEPGELLAPGAGLAVITDLQDAWLTVYVGEPDLGRIRLGQKAAIVTDDGQQREGTVSFVSPRAEFTPKNVQTRDERVKLVYRLKVALPNADGLFKPGMPAEARLEPAR